MEIKTLLLALALCGLTAARSQVSITGPGCVLPGVQYQYLISTPDTTGAGIHICLTGGIYSAGGGTCLDDSLVASVLVVWNTGVTSAAISFNSNAGTAAKTISLSSTLQPGGIDTASQVQTVGYGSTFSAITCTDATGGNCSPAYNYQWQQSADNLVWSDISGATGKDLSTGAALTQTTYFRRKVTEKASGTIGYSNAATVMVTYPSGSANIHTPKNNTVSSVGVAPQYNALYCKTTGTYTGNL